MPDSEVILLLETIALDLAEIKARQRASDQMWLVVYEEFAAFVTSLAEEYNLNAPSLLSARMKAKYQEIFDAHCAACRNEMAEKVREARDKAAFPFFVD